MDYKIKKLPKSVVEITITVPAEKMPEFQRKASEEIAKDVEIKGFRKGHVPADVLDKHIDKRYILAHTQELAIRATYAEAVTAEKLQVVSRPEVKVESEDPLTYVATVTVMPEIKMKDYKSIKVKKEEVKVEDKDLEAVIDDMKKYGVIYREVDREIKKGDRAEIDFEGFDNGVAVERTKSTNHPVIVGENTLIPGFEDHLIGMKKGEKKEFDIKFPDDYGQKSFQGRTLKFKIEVKRTEEALLPELDEALIEKATGQKHTVEEFKKELTENIRLKKEDEAKIKRENEYIEKLLKEMEVEIPDVLIDDESQHILNEVKEDIKEKGIEFEKYLEYTKTTVEELLKKYCGEAEKRVKIRMALQYILKAEDIKVTDEELMADLNRIKAMYPAEEQKKVESDFASGNLATQIANRLAIQKLFAKVLAE